MDGQLLSATFVELTDTMVAFVDRAETLNSLADSKPPRPAGTGQPPRQSRPGSRPAVDPPGSAPPPAGRVRCTLTVPAPMHARDKFYTYYV